MTSPSTHRSVLLSLAAAALLAAMTAPTTVSAQAVIGDTICVEGFVMDEYCIDNVVMIDNGIKTLESPGAHSVHCLVDVGVCRDSPYEILGDPVNAGGLYTRGFQVDEGVDAGAGKALLLDVARTVGDKARGCTS
ncbi:MAG: hypothetical protein SGARI_004505, partial [Bacillariaceae sp.]